MEDIPHARPLKGSADYFLTFFDDIEAPKDDFSRIFRGSPEIVDLVYFYDV